MYRSGVIKGSKAERFLMPSLDHWAENFKRQKQSEDSGDFGESALEGAPDVDDELSASGTAAEDAADESQISSPPEEPGLMPEEPGPTPEEIIAAAEERALLIEQEAQKRGYENGFNAGQEAGGKQAQEEFNQKNLPLLDGLSKIIAELNTVKEDVLSTVEPAVVQLSEAMAKAAILAELKLDPEILIRLAKEGINRLKKTGSITIKINPALYELFLSRKAELTEIHPEIIFETDPAMPPEGTQVIGPIDEVSVNPLELLDNILEQMREHDAGGG